MIVFDLRCAQAHVFEAWFGSSAAFEDQRAAGFVACPICGDTDVGKAVMAPNVAAKGNRAMVPSQAARMPAPTDVKATLAAMAALQAKALAKSEWVGPRFAARARSMHDGREPEATIHGQATLAEARALLDDGVPVAPLLVPVVPPEACN